MWSVWVSVVTTLLLVFITRWVYRWRNPKCNGKLPPGSMGFPFIGETIDFLTPSKSVDIHSFIKKRMTKYGSLFKTNLATHPVVISTDPETNFYLLQQHGKLVEMWYMDSFEKILHTDKIMEAKTASASFDYMHKYFRNILLNHFGLNAIKEKLLPMLDESISRRVQAWSKLPALEVKHATTAMICDFTAKQFFSYDAEKSGESIGDSFTNFLQGILSFPLNIPGTTFHKCLKNGKKVVDLIRKEVQERKANPGKGKGDFLDDIRKDMSKEKFLTEDFIIYVTFGAFFASFETISETLTLALLFLTEHPSVVQELEEEHETILKDRGDANSGVTWDEYKSMTFTHDVISESLRFVNVGPGIMRRALKDIPINGFIIPKGWAIMVPPSSVQLSPNNYDDPLVFNPWRWKHIRETVVAKNFIPFGGGSRSCVGADFSKVLMAVFLHKFVTKYRWTKLKGGEVIRTPALSFGDGFHIQVYEKE